MREWPTLGHIRAQACRQNMAFMTSCPCCVTHSKAIEKIAVMKTITWLLCFGAAACARYFRTCGGSSYDIARDCKSAEITLMYMTDTTKPRLLLVSSNTSVETPRTIARNVEFVSPHPEMLSTYELGRLHAFLKAKLPSGLSIEESCDSDEITNRHQEKPSYSGLLAEQAEREAAGISAKIYETEDGLPPAIFIDDDKLFKAAFPELADVIPLVEKAGGVVPFTYGQPAWRFNEYRARPREEKKARSRKVRKVEQSEAETQPEHRPMDGSASYATTPLSMANTTKPNLLLVSNNSAETPSGVLDDDFTYSFTLLDCISPTATDLSQAECSRLYALYESYRELMGDLPCEVFVAGDGSLLVEKYAMMFDFVQLVKKAGGTVSFHRGIVSTSPTPSVQRCVQEYRAAKKL